MYSQYLIITKPPNFSRTTAVTNKNQTIKYLTITLLIATIISISTLTNQNTAKADTTTFGITQTGTAVMTFATYKDATKFQLTQTGTIQSITVYFANTGYSAKTAIYSDQNGAPANLLTQSTSQTITTAGWTTFPITPITLQPGDYWLTVIASNRKAQGRYTYTATPNQHYQTNTAYAGEFAIQFMPTSTSSTSSSFASMGGPSTAIIDSYATSIYATYTPTNPTATPNPTPVPSPSSTSNPTPNPTGPSDVFGNAQLGTKATLFATSKDATLFELTELGVVQNISVYFGNTGYSAKTAVYSDASGKPGQLIVQSGTKTVGTAGWNTFPIAPTTLSPGNYWLAVVTNNRKASGRYVNLFVPDQHYQTSAIFSGEFTTEFAGAVNSFGGSSLKSDAFATCIYASYVPVNPSPTSTPTPSPTPTPTVSPTPTSSPVVGQRAIQLYNDAACTTVISDISWGSLQAGTTKSLVIYVRNEGNVAVTLMRTLTNFDPADIANYFTFTWDYNGQPMNSGAVLRLTLYLTAAANVPAEIGFSFDTVITAVSS
jgi:hypothetical protein